MIKDKIPDYFDILTRKLDEIYGENMVGYSQRKNDSPAKFPHVYFHQIGGTDLFKTLSGNHGGLRITVEIAAYHNEGTEQIRELADVIRKVMTDNAGELQFDCELYTPRENVIDPSIQMFVMRFSKIDTEEE